MVFDTSTAGLLAVIVGVLLPILVAFVTKQSTLGKYKAVILLALSGISSVLFAWHDAAANNTDWDAKNVVLGAIVTFVIAVAAHAGLWKPTEVTGANGAIQRKTANVGL